MKLTRRALIGSMPLLAQTGNYPPSLPGFEKELYRKVDDVELNMWIIGRGGR